MDGYSYNYLNIFSLGHLVNALYNVILIYNHIISYFNTSIKIILDKPPNSMYDKYNVVLAENC